jgi:proteasome lid subunit RPN8/RPN11
MSDALPRPRRIDLDPQLPPVTLSPRAWIELAGHALETWPEECCGLVSGPARGTYIHVHRCRNEMTRLHAEDPMRHPHDGRRAFHMNELDYLDALKRAEAHGELVTAVYHSHVGARAYLSELDLAYATQALFPFPDADQIVLSVLEGGRLHEAGIFLRSADRFQGRLLCPAP